MTIPTREEALRALDKLSSDYDLAGGWSPDPMPLLVTLRSYIESHTGEVMAHEWHERFGLTCCKVCGFVRNENSDAKGCRGPVYVSLRDASPLQPVKLEWAGTSLRYNGIVIGHIDRQDMSDPPQWVARLGVGYDVTPTVVGFLRGDSAGELQAIAEARSALESAARKWLSGGDK